MYFPCLSNPFMDSLLFFVLSFVNKVMARKTFFLCLIPFSLFFWIWSYIKNVQRESGDPDFKVISFGFVLGSSLYALGLINAYDEVQEEEEGNNTHHHQLGWPVRIVATSSHLLVVINYAPAALFGFTGQDGKTVSYGIYAAVFTVIWVGISVLGCNVLSPREKAST